MYTDLVNICLAFLEGLALILSPCILPILPIVLSASLEGGHKRPYGVLVGFVVSFALFTFFSRQLILSLGIDLNIIRNISFSLLLLLGIVMMSSFLTTKFNQLTTRIADVGNNLINNGASQSGFYGGLLFGALIGLIWTPCAGPILAAVIVQSIVQKTNFYSFLTILAFAVGAAIPMLLIILFGRALTTKIKVLQLHAELIRKILGAIIVLAVVIMIYGVVPFTTKQETNSSSITGKQLQNGIAKPYPAPDFSDITAWINSPPLHIQQLKCKVVLLDFWAYSCINCIRTLPYLLDWYKKYQSEGFEIIGVHSPEFDFERDLENVKKAVIADGIKYPVALDNQFATWNNYQNQYWPAHYLIDKNGYVVYTHFGEGEYDVTENNIRYLLGLQPATSNAVANDQFTLTTPETYLGYSRSIAYVGNESVKRDQANIYTLPAHIPLNCWALQGSWKVEVEKIISTSTNSVIKIHYSAKHVFAVMGAPKAIKVTVKNNARDITTLEVSRHTLYTLLNLEKVESGELELYVNEAGLELYTFTFGG